ncbi:MAG: trypsin-like peptidase domain-containing protein, partial [Myxococcales bacterium]|nr:trypsin-like peptidase domain-containing protein [Myxococcales bacterium]
MRPTQKTHLLFFVLPLLTWGIGATSARTAGDPFLRRTATVRAVERVGPSVVNITTERRVRARSPFQPFAGTPGFDRFFRDFFEPRRPSQRSNLGSGVVIDREGHVLTNEHVVAAADSIRVTLADGREFEATLVGADPNNDLAVLALVDATNVPWTAPGTSEDLMVGEPVIAIGNPFGLSNSVTTGVLSALDRSIRSNDRVFHGFLQTDASINPGNSGGPLLNATGDLVGVNTAIYQGAEGIGFAIPIDVADRIVRELITHGVLAPVWLGLDLQDLDGRVAELMNLPDMTSGALVNRVRAESPAALAGVQRGDVVTAVDGHD